MNVDPAPFDLGPADSPTAVLCVHGLTGTPWEVRPFAETLARRGVRARGLLLPGHGTDPEELAETPREDWVEAVGQATDELRASHDYVALVGMSLGGVLSLRTAEVRRVDALVSVGAPLELAPVARWMVPIAKYLVPQLPKRSGPDIRDPEARARHPGYPSMPLAAVHELIRLQREVVVDLHRIEAPLLVAHGEHDRTAPPSNALLIYEGVSSKVRELVMYPDSAHVVPVDHDGPALVERAVEFLGQHVPLDGGGSPAGPN